MESQAALFRRLEALIYDEHLYRDGAFDRQAVCKRLGIDRHVLNRLLNTHADGLSWPAYINNVRLDTARGLLLSEPLDTSLTQIAASVGLSLQNMRLLFKKHYGVTPTEYRENRL
ncbi:MAG: helix-turn-helix domain-containing protein [Bacteroidaceae bacterium]|nr:helix-turn-helix domain-containing protein [Bacteroidaceae bacterium]